MDRGGREVVVEEHAEGSQYVSRLHQRSLLDHRVLVHLILQIVWRQSEQLAQLVPNLHDGNLVVSVDSPNCCRGLGCEMEEEEVATLLLTDFVALAAQVDDCATDFLSMLHCLANQYEKLRGRGQREGHLIPLRGGQHDSPNFLPHPAKACPAPVCCSVQC